MSRSLGKVATCRSYLPGATWRVLHAGCYLPGATWRVLPAGCYLKGATWRVLPAGCYLPGVTSRVLPAWCYLPRTTCRVLPAACCLLGTTCRMLPAGCYLPDATCRVRSGTKGCYEHPNTIGRIRTNDMIYNCKKSDQGVSSRSSLHCQFRVCDKPWFHYVIWTLVCWFE